MTISEKFTCVVWFFFLYYLIWMPKIWCFFRFCFGQVSMGALSWFNTHTHTRVRLVSSSLFPLFFFPFLEFVVVTVHVPSPVCHAPICCQVNTFKPKLTDEKKKKTPVVMTSLLWMFAFCVSLPLCTVTFVFQSGHTCIWASPVCCFVFMQ